MDNFFQNMDEPKDLDLRTSFVSPITGISILINNFNLYLQDFTLTRIKKFYITTIISDFKDKIVILYLI